MKQKPTQLTKKNTSHSQINPISLALAVAFAVIAFAALYKAASSPTYNNPKASNASCPDGFHAKITGDRRCDKNGNNCHTTQVTKCVLNVKPRPTEPETLQSINGGGGVITPKPVQPGSYIDSLGN